MEPGFEKGNSNNLPCVDYEMILSFYSTNENYLSAEMRGQKNIRGSRQTYGDSAVGYVQVKREASCCTVISRITPEHRVSKIAYRTTIQIDEANNSVKSVLCDGCPASAGGCKHGIALLFWLHRRSEEPSVTDTICYWKKSELSKVGSSKKFILLKDITPTANLDLPNKDDFLQKILENGDIADCTLINLHKKSQLENLSLHYLYISYCEENGNKNSADEFLTFCSARMTSEDCEYAKVASIEQSKSPIWYELKYGRITASKIYEASRCTTDDGSLVETIFGATKFPETIAMKRGLQLEEEVLQECEKKCNMKFKRCGLVLDKKYPTLGASPDAVSENFVVEIKCPFKEKTVNNYINNNKVNAKYFAQIQTQMHFCRKTKGIFVVADPNFIENRHINIYFVDYDKPFCIDLINKAMEFWKNHVFNKFK